MNSDRMTFGFEPQQCLFQTEPYSAVWVAIWPITMSLQTDVVASFKLIVAGCYIIVLCCTSWIHIADALTCSRALSLHWEFVCSCRFMHWKAVQLFGEICCWLFCVCCCQRPRTVQFNIWRHRDAIVSCASPVGPCCLKTGEEQTQLFNTSSSSTVMSPALAQ